MVVLMLHALISAGYIGLALIGLLKLLG